MELKFQRKAFPQQIHDIFDESESMELLSLQPWMRHDEAKRLFHDEAVIGSLFIEESEQQGRVFDELRGTLTWHPFKASCFFPRHGLRVTKQDKTVDVLWCYQCDRLHVISEEHPGYHSLAINSDSKDFFNALFDEAQVSRDIPKGE